MTDKVIRDGAVAVLYSPGYGAGWYTWNSESPALLFDPELVRLVEAGAPIDAIEARAHEVYPDGYFGGARDLKIRWLPIGTQFRISEYDGSESIETSDNVDWHLT